MARSAAGTPRRILLVEADPVLRSAVSTAFLDSGLDVELTPAGSAAEALAMLDAGAHEVMLLPVRVPDLPASDLLREALARHPHMRVLVLADDESETSAVAFLRDGAADYLPLRGCALARLPHLCLRLADEAVHRAATRHVAGTSPSGRPRPGSDPFLSALSHDLRTPLAGLLALLDMLESGTDGPLTPAQIARIARIRSTLNRLVSIAGQVGDLALVESGRLSLVTGKVDLAGVALLAAQDTEPAGRSRAVDLQLRLENDLPPVRGDAARIRQILVILIDNALKHAGRSTLEIGAKRLGAAVEVTLRGAPPAFAGEAEPDGSADPGLALDLSVARGLVALHGGHLRVEPDAWEASFTLHAATDDRQRAGTPEELRPRT